MKNNKEIDPKETAQNYSKRLTNQKQKIASLFNSHKKAIEEFNSLQIKFTDQYKHLIIKKYLNIWDQGKFPLDNELTDMIFSLAGLPLEDGKTKPKTIITLNDKCEFKLKYFNKRLKSWVEVKP